MVDYQALYYVDALIYDIQYGLNEDIRQDGSFDAGGIL